MLFVLDVGSPKFQFQLVIWEGEGMVDRSVKVVGAPKQSPAKLNMACGLSNTCTAMVVSWVHPPELVTTRVTLYVPTAL